MVYSGSRADYGLVKWVFLELSRDSDCDSYFIFGHPDQEPTLLTDPAGLPSETIEPHTTVGTSSQALSTEEKRIIEHFNRQLDFSNTVFAQVKPDYLVVLGDRFEILAPVLAAGLHKVRIAHLCGGDIGQGTIDNSVRDAVTKLSHLHLVTNDFAVSRVLQLGENQNLIVNVGTLSTDGWMKRERFSAIQIRQTLGLEEWDEYGLITVHPCPLDSLSDHQIIATLGEVLKGVRALGLRIVLTLPNLEVSTRLFIDELLKNSEVRNPNVKIFQKLGHEKYLAALEFSRFCLGNSSSGIYEAPLARIPTIDIGVRQQGRIKSDSVFHVDWDAPQILKAISQAVALPHSGVSTFELRPAAEMVVDALKTKMHEIKLDKKFYLR